MLKLWDAMELSSAVEQNQRPLHLESASVADASCEMRCMVVCHNRFPEAPEDELLGGRPCRALMVRALRALSVDARLQL